MSKSRIDLGKRGEEAAVSYLKSKGYRILSRNYRQKSGEIDIVCKDGDGYVFIEVKTRHGSKFGDPVEAVTMRKQQQIHRTAIDYLARNNLLDAPARFDVIGIIMAEDRIEISHIVNAFDAG